jgi:hypothetical protein
MNEDDWEMNVQRVARQLEYPPTPDLANRVQRHITVKPVRLELRRVAAVFLVALLLAVSLLAVPPIRALVWSFFRIGVVEVVPVSATFVPTLEADFFGLETTLDEAQRKFGAVLPLPSVEIYGQPNAVYFPNADLTAVTLVYLHDDSRVNFAYSVIRGGYIQKFYPVMAEPLEVSVGDYYGVWLQDPHVLQAGEPEDPMFMRRFVSDHVLLWTDGTLTYRLETNADLEATMQIAERVE